MKSKFLSFITPVLLLILLLGINDSTFAQKNTVTPPAGNVTLFFDGIEALFFGDPNYVSVGILDVHNHTPKITVTRVASTQRTIVAQFAAEQLRGATYIDVVDAQGKPKLGIERRISPVMENDPFDFRWLLDFSEIYADRGLTIKEENLFGKIHISNGLFYAENLSKNIAKLFSVSGSPRGGLLNRRVGAPATKITINDGETLVISGGFTPLRLTGDKQSQYEIDITNLPPPAQMSLDHFLHYYEIIEQPVTKYIPVFVGQAAYRPFPALCDASVFTKNKLKKP
jgi:hypothetical protein